MNKRIYLCLAHMSETGMEHMYIREAFDTNWVVPLGPNVNGFEEAMERFLMRKKLPIVNRNKSLPSPPVLLPSILHCWLVVSVLAMK